MTEFFTEYQMILIGLAGVFGMLMAFGIGANDVANNVGPSVGSGALTLTAAIAIAFVFDGLFKGLAEAVTLRNTLLIATFLGFIPVLLIGDYFGLKLYAIWIAFTVWMFLRMIILVVVFRRKYLVNTKI